MRERISLDGVWAFQFDPGRSLTPESIQPDRDIVVPMPWQAQFDDLRYCSGVGWYRRTFHLSQPPAQAALLHFGAVDYQTTVWLNGACAGEHEGGYLPFTLDVGNLLRPGQNVLLVRVADPDEDSRHWPEFRFSEIPHGKQSWYGPLSGIWQSVWLEMRSHSHIRSLRLSPDCDRNAIDVCVSLTTPNPDLRLHFQVSDPDGQTVAEMWAGPADPIALPLEAPAQRWGIGQPALYTVTATLWHKGRPIDRLADHCGFRTVAARDGHIYLNEEPLYLRGILDQGYYPQTIYTPPDVSLLEDQARKAMDLGFNCLRCHIKIEDPRYYDTADRLGLPVWTELPNWTHLSPRARRLARDTFRGMVQRDWNHPSIIAWTLVNEDWGTDLAHDSEHQQWLADFYREAKVIDPTRLITDNSACAPNFHVSSDLEDFHHYRVIPDHASDWDHWVAAFAGRADWTWAPDYHNRRNGAPLILSEFGAWGLPHPDDLHEDGAEPWWFESGQEWADGVVYPHGLRRRFDFWRLERVFGSFDHFIAAHQRHMARSLSYKTGSIRRQPAITGYVVTELTDVHWEANGLLDMQRNVKQHLDPFVALNQDCVVVLRPQRYSAQAGSELCIEVQAFGVTGPANHGTIRWETATAAGHLAAPGGEIHLRLPHGAAGSTVTVRASWLDEHGRELASGTVDLACIAPLAQRPALHVVANPPLARALSALGYPLRSSDEEAIWIATDYTSDVRRALQQGRRVLLLADGPTSEPLPMGRVAKRAGTVWQGDWATSFSWLHKDGPFARFPGGPLLDMAYRPVMPDSVLEGLPAWLMRDQSWAGLAVGWLHKHVSLLASMPYGQGRLVVNTLRLTPQVLAEDPLARALFAAILQLLPPEQERPRPIRRHDPQPETADFFLPE